MTQTRLALDGPPLPGVRVSGWWQLFARLDAESQAHARRVAGLSVSFARHLGLKDQEIRRLWKGSLLHDIGKLAVPSDILLKPGPLTEAEFRIMRMHPTYAFQIMWPVADLFDSIDVSYCHHEQWNGSGYPQGLRGEDIPRAARILGLVDVADALASDRPYRPKRGEDEIREFIEARAGSHFDPALAREFLRFALPRAGEARLAIEEPPQTDQAR